MHASSGGDCAVAVDRRYAGLGTRGARQGQLPAASGNLADSPGAAVGSSRGTIAMRFDARSVALGPAVQPPGTGRTSSRRAWRAALGFSEVGAGTALSGKAVAGRGARRS